MVVIHSTGAHRIGVHFCKCEEAAADNLQLLKLGLYPASVKTPKSAFTFSALDDSCNQN
ncbi:hypothetical protein OF83DRAFT_1037229, partial [Amylostereum chailletii]